LLRGRRLVTSGRESPRCVGRSGCCRVRRCSPVIRLLRRSGSDASHKVPVPFSVHRPCRVSPVQPASGRFRFGVAALSISVTGTHRDGLYGGRSPLRFFASSPTGDPRPIVLSDGRFVWIAGASAPLATGHASPIFVLDSDDVPLPVLASGSQPGRGRPSRVIEHLI